MSETRRRFIGLLGVAPMAAVLAPRIASAQAASCYSPDALSWSEKSTRRAVGFVDQAPDPAKRCGTCAFFVAAQNGCGKCQILSGGPVPAQAYCTSYAPKAK
jgi:hypothetical protein